jgi:hypothetical protein
MATAQVCHHHELKGAGDEEELTSPRAATFTTRPTPSIVVHTS